MFALEEYFKEQVPIFAAAQPAVRESDARHIVGKITNEIVASAQ